MDDKFESKTVRGNGLDEILTHDIPEDLGYAPGSVVLDPHTGEIKPNLLYKAPESTAPDGSEGLDYDEAVNSLNNIDQFCQKFEDLSRADDLQSKMRAGQIYRHACKLLGAEDIVLSEQSKAKLLEIQKTYREQLEAATKAREAADSQRTQAWLNKNRP